MDFLTYKLLRDRFRHYAHNVLMTVGRTTLVLLKRPFVSLPIVDLRDGYEFLP